MKRNKTWIASAFAAGAVVATFAMPGAINANEATVTKQFINPTMFGYTETVAVSANGVRTIYVSGQVGQGEGGFADVPEGLAAQADRAFANLISELEAAGATPDDVVKLNAYIVGMDLTTATVVGTAKDKYFTGENQPASTWVGVSSLVTPQMLVEVEAVAVLDH